MLIVSQSGNIRVNYNNVTGIELKKVFSNEKEEYKIVAHLNDKAEVTLYSSLILNSAQKALVALDEAIIKAETYKHLNLSSEKEIENLYKDMYIFYMADCEA